MNFDNIREIFDRYIILKDAMTITFRAFSHNLSNFYQNLYQRTKFEFIKQSEAENKKEEALAELDKLTILSLFANFEFELREEISKNFDGLKQLLPIELRNNLCLYTQKEIMFWKIDNVIDIFDYAVDGDTRGYMKKVLKFRNQIAHGKEINISEKLMPLDVYKKIESFYLQINSKITGNINQ